MSMSSENSHPAGVSAEKNRSIARAMRAERNYLKPFLLSYVKEHPECSEEEALAEWKVLALAGRPADRPFRLQLAKGVLLEYRANLAAMGCIAVHTWEAHRSWLLREGRWHRREVGETRWYSAMDEALIAERMFLKAHILSYIKGHPECSEAEVVAEWKAVALEARPEDRQWPLVSTAGLLKEYRANLAEDKAIPAPTWEAQRAWILTNF